VSESGCFDQNKLYPFGRSVKMYTVVPVKTVQLKALFTGSTEFQVT